jgi:hypothetical protein
VESRCNKLGEGTDLPAGIIGKSRDLHSVRSSTRSRRRTLVPHAALSVSSSAGKLNGEAFSHKVGSMESWNYVASIHSILILDESETVHKLHFGNISGAVGRKVSLDIGLGS